MDAVEDAFDGGFKVNDAGEVDEFEEDGNFR